MATYTIKGGDTLSQIAQNLGYGGDYARLARENNIANPNVIRAGQVINYGAAPVPAPAPVPTSQPVQQSQPQVQSYSQPQSQPQSGQPGSVQDLINMGYSGYQGWDSAGALADFRATGGSGKGGPSSSGGGGSTSGAFTQPTIDLGGIYKSLYESSPIQATQTQFDDLTKQIEQKQLALNEARSKIADNPYLSEATMSGRLAKLDAKFNDDVKALTGQQANLQNKIATSKADIETQLNLQTKQFDINSQQATQALNQFNSLLASGALDNASGTDIANITRSTGLSSSMIQSAIKASQNSKVQTQTISYDDGTNSGFVTINTRTGEVINKQAIGASAKTASSGGGSATTSAKQTKADEAKQASFEKAIADGIKQLQGGAQWGEVWNRIKKLFPEAPPELIDTLLGPSWRQPGAYQSYLATKKGY